MSSDMLREVSESLFEYLIEAFPTDRSYSRIDIEQDPMPPLLAHFLGQTLQYRLDIEVEHIRTVRSSWFDYDHPDVQHAYKSFVASLAQHAHIPAEEWRSTLKRATKLVIAHLILPTHTLVEFVFREEEGPLAAPVIYREISYFAAYPYLREAVETFLKKRQLKEIDRTRFSSLLMQVDRHMTANYSADQWMRMLRPLFDLMRRVPQTRNQGVPIDMLSMFFGDKEAYEIQGRLQVEKEVHRITTIDIDGLRRVIEGSVGPFEQELTSTKQPKPVQSANIESEASTEPPPSYLPKEEVPEEKSTAPSSSAEASEESADDQPKPLWAQFQKTPAPSEKEAGPVETPATQDSDDAVPLWMRFQKAGPTPATTSAVLNAQTEPSKDAGPENVEQNMREQSEPSQETAQHTPSDRQPAPSHADGHNTYSPPSPEPVASYNSPMTPPPSSPYATKDTPPAFPHEMPYQGSSSQSLSLEQLEQDVLGSFGAGNRAMFVEHLFAGSNEEYEQLLVRLREMDSWEEASQVIADAVFKRYQVNIYSPAAIMFTESIEEQFRSQ